MKKYAFNLIVLFMFSCMCNLYGYTIAHKWKCEKIIKTGNYAQLKKLESDILAKIEMPSHKSDKGELYDLMGQIYQGLGYYNEALKWHKLAIQEYEFIDYAIQENKEHLYYYAQSLINYADVQKYLELDYKKCIDFYPTAEVKFSEWVCNVVFDSTDYRHEAKRRYGNYLLSLADARMFIQCGENDKASGKIEDAIRSLKLLYGAQYESTIEYVDILLVKTDINERTRNNEQSLKCCKQALEIVESTIGKTSMLYSGLLTRLGAIYQQLNDEVLSRTCFSESLDVIIKNGYKEHLLQVGPLLGLGAWGLQYLLLNFGKSSAKMYYDKGVMYYNKALELNKKFLGDNSPYNLLCKSHIVTIDMYWGLKSGNINEVMDKLNDIFKPMLESHNIQLIESAIVLSGELQKIISLIPNTSNAAVDLFENFLKQIMDIAPIETRRDLYVSAGQAYMNIKDYNKAVKMCNKALDYHRSIIQHNFQFLSEHKRQKFGEHHSSAIENLFAISGITNRESATIGGFMYNASLLNKSLLLQASVNLAHIVHNSGDQKLKDKFEYLRITNQEMVDKGETDSQVLIDMESEILNMSKKYGNFMSYSSSTWKDIQNALGEEDIAIEFVSSRDNIGPLIIHRYSAEVISKNMTSPKHLILFTIPESKLSSLNNAPGKFSEIILRNIWKEELLELIGDKKNVYFVPDGELYNIGIEYIPVAEGKRMCDMYNMCRLSSSREILNSKKQITNFTCALFGGMNYNTSLSDMELYAYSASERGITSFDFVVDKSAGYSSWGYLPGTLNEVNSISTTLGNSGYSVNSLTGSEAVEETFKALSGQKTNIIHIATHGYYLPDKGDALQNSGLVFAGANNFWNSDKKIVNKTFDDGLLTAKEISYLNLMGTDLVVMSACQTGLGKVKGEGVFGLQRAFKMAGVQTLLMSLWEVDDEVTHLLMNEFYNALTNGQTKRQALKSAQEKIRNHTFIRNGQKVSGDNPYYWSAFIMMD